MNDPAIANRLDRLVNQQLNVPLVFGTITSDNNDIYNSSLIWKPGEGITDQYDKKRPVPFAEYVPDRDFWYPLAPNLIGLITRGYTFGTRDPIFEVDSHRFGVLICFEIAVDEIAQSIVDSGAEAIISQTNNADFGYSDEAFQQIAIAKLRSIETGLPLINVSTTGPSGAFSGSGKELNMVAAFEPHSFVADLPLRKSDTPAMGLGRYFDIFNVFACVILVLILEWRKKKRSA
jgi:apolipoprotein N-acyltransferase